MIFGRDKTQLPTRETALPGRATRPFAVGDRHLVTGNPIETDGPEGFEVAVFGLGCFWGEEKTFWEQPGVWSTSVGYAGGVTPHPTYDEVCTGMTGHAEVVRVIFDPAVTSYDQLLKVFWENHDPTQGMRQGNDRGSQYRSILLTTSEEQQRKAEASREAYQRQMTAHGYGQITTEIRPLDAYFYAEEFHQQYLVKNPFGYCPLHATGVQYADA
ncbi:peptide-methionine (S)-S-oxide reductase MsrA [Aeromicrobium phragmitis]|uniref:Peptide methionine sulfoxide reductase MsrA n=1 Tax=Aeromicrobium phragmitis TaxID=2478914 RepID=A0A3L8PLM6_9ACTN|nr:peptide-methionine (S)-S-oxide reductase MsrA [Aeromicrobium phragmitis]RLV55719.1 peptide-methionine (S)-S-oxide reductase MsrA [Aeromicrobium phragmitis]